MPDDQDQQTIDDQSATQVGESDQETSQDQVTDESAGKTTGDQGNEQQASDDQSQRQQTSVDQDDSAQSTTDESQGQEVMDDQSGGQQTTDDQSQGQQTTEDQGAGQQTTEDQSLDQQTRDDQGSQAGQSGGEGAKQGFVDTQSAQTQGTGAQAQPQGRLGPGDHAWYYNGKISTDKNVPRATWFPNSNPNDPNDYQGHGGEIWHYVVHANGQIFAGQPHLRNHPGTFAWLNNNPGNITGVPGGANWGQYPNKFNWHNFLIFPSPEAGFDAIARFLRNASYPAKTRGTRQWPAGKYRDLSITEAFHRYAPEEDGNTPDKYGADVAAAAGVSQATLVGNLDDAQMLKMQTKIREIEGVVKGRELTRDHADLPDAVRAALA